MKQPIASDPSWGAEFVIFFNDLRIYNRGFIKNLIWRGRVIEFVFVASFAVNHTPILMSVLE